MSMCSQGIASSAEESTGVGQVPWDYYTHNLLAPNGREIALAPGAPQPRVSIYEDLTTAAAGAGPSPGA